MPSNRLSFPVLVRRDVQFVGRLELRAKLPNDLLLVGWDDVDRLKAVSDIHTETCPGLVPKVLRDFRCRGGQVPNVAHARFDLEIRRKIIANGSGLCRRLYNNESLH